MIEPGLPPPERPLGDFYGDLSGGIQYAKMTAKFKAIVSAWIREETVQNICDTFGVTRSDVALAIRLSGVRRGMDTHSMAPEDVANLYSLLYAAQLEIESLRRQLNGL